MHEINHSVTWQQQSTRQSVFASGNNLPEAQGHHACSCSCSRPEGACCWLWHAVDIEVSGIGVEVAQQVQRGPFLQIDERVRAVASVLTAAPSAIIVVADIHHTDPDCTGTVSLHNDIDGFATQCREPIPRCGHLPRTHSRLRPTARHLPLLSRPARQTLSAVGHSTNRGRQAGVGVARSRR